MPSEAPFPHCKHRTDCSLSLFSLQWAPALQSRVLAPQAARGRGPCPDPLQHNDTGQPTLSHAGQKQSLRHSPNGLSPGAGAPECFPDLFRSLQLMRQQCDRGKMKIHSGAARAPHMAHSVVGRILWEKTPGRLRRNVIWLLELKGTHLS